MKAWTTDQVSARIQKTLIAAVVGVFLCLYFFLPSGRQQEHGPQVVALQGSSMGTTWSVQLVTDADARKITALGDSISSLLNRLDKQIFSTYETDSELSRLNRAATGQPFPVSYEMLEVSESALSVYRQSNGAFDPTVEPLVRLWGFGATPPVETISDQQIAEAQQKMGMQFLEIDRQQASITRHQDISLDFSGIAKGYAADRMAELLISSGYRDFLAELGGELRVQGSKPDEDGWQIAVERPEPGTRQAQLIISTDGRALALSGSGDYRNFRIDASGRRLSHEIDPRSGRPVEHDLAAVTIVAKTAMQADAWATAMMILGPQEGMQLADGLNLAAYFIIRDQDGFRSTASKAFAAVMEAPGQPVPQ